MRTFLILVVFFPSILMSQSKEAIMAELIEQSLAYDVPTAINTIKEHFNDHASSTIPYILHNTQIEISESEPCLCDIKVDEYYNKLYFDDKRTIVYHFDLGDLIMRHDWIHENEIFRLKMHHESYADVKVYSDSKLQKEITTDIVEFASPKNKEDEMIMSFARLYKACSSDENIIRPKININTNKTGDELILSLSDSKKPKIVSVNPDLDITGDELLSDKPKYNIEFKMLYSRRIPLSDIHIDINNMPIALDGKKHTYNLTQTESGYLYHYKNEVDLVYGSNIVSIAIETPEGIIGLDPYDVKYLPVRPNLFVYTMGIPSEDLKYTSDDASDIGEIFKTQNGVQSLFENIKVKVVTSKKETSKEGLARQFETIKNDFLLKNAIGINDVLIIYLSSHGFFDEQSKKYKIAASNYDPLYANSSSLDFENDILDVIASVNCKKIFLLDACYSGSVDYQKYDGAKSHDSREIELAKSLSVLVNGKNDSYFIVSSSQDEKSYEDPEWQNGAFTEAILDGLRPKENSFALADDNADNIIYLFELVDYLQEAVPRLVNSKKPKATTSLNPILIDGLEKLDIPIFSY